MRSFINFAIVAGFASFLSGCYETAEPLITPANADYPLGDGHAYQFDDGTVGTIWLDDTLASGARYLHQMGPEGEPEVLLFRNIRDNYYVVQREKITTFEYALVRIEDIAVYNYNLRCDPALDHAAIAQGDLVVTDKIAADGVPACVPRDIEALGNLLMTRAGISEPGTVHHLTGPANGPP